MLTSKLPRQTSQPHSSVTTAEREAKPSGVQNLWCGGNSPGRENSLALWCCFGVVTAVGRALLPCDLLSLHLGCTYSLCGDRCTEKQSEQPWGIAPFLPGAFAPPHLCDQPLEASSAACWAERCSRWKPARDGVRQCSPLGLQHRRKGGGEVGPRSARWAQETDRLSQAADWDTFIQIR